MTTASTQNTTATEIAGALLDIEAIKLRPNDPFQWASGWNSPIYCDNRLSLSFPEIRSFITQALVEAIKQNFSDVEAIAGVATAGIPQGALIAAELGLPFLYVRSAPKSHGMTNTIEGKIIEGQKVVVIEDLVSTGGSSLKAVADLKNAGFSVLGMAAIFTYGFDVADTNFKEANVALVCLSNYNVLLEEAKQRNIVKEEELASLNEWRKAPDKWNK